MVIGVLVGAMAIGFSAFTNAKPNMGNAKTIPAGFLVQVSNGLYEYRSSLSNGTCQYTSPNPCHYNVASSNNIPSGQTQFTKAQVNTYTGLSNPARNQLWVE